MRPAWGDYRQWSDHFAVTDANGQPLLPNGVGSVSSTLIGVPALGQVQVDVTVQWDSGFRTAGAHIEHDSRAAMIFDGLITVGEQE